MHALPALLAGLCAAALRGVAGQALHTPLPPSLPPPFTLAPPQFTRAPLPPRTPSPPTPNAVVGNAYVSSSALSASARPSRYVASGGGWVQFTLVVRQLYAPPCAGVPWLVVTGAGVSLRMMLAKVLAGAGVAGVPGVTIAGVASGDGGVAEVGGVGAPAMARLNAATQAGSLVDLSSCAEPVGGSGGGGGGASPSSYAAPPAVAADLTVTVRAAPRNASAAGVRDLYAGVLELDADAVLARLLREWERGGEGGGGGRPAQRHRALPSATSHPHRGTPPSPPTAASSFATAAGATLDRQPGSIQLVLPEAGWVGGGVQAPAPGGGSSGGGGRGGLPPDLLLSAVVGSVLGALVLLAATAVAWLLLRGRERSGQLQAAAVRSSHPPGTHTAAKAAGWQPRAEAVKRAQHARAQDGSNTSVGSVDSAAAGWGWGAR